MRGRALQQHVRSQGEAKQPHSRACWSSSAGAAQPWDPLRRGDQLPVEAEGRGDGGLWVVSAERAVLRAAVLQELLLRPSSQVCVCPAAAGRRGCSGPAAAGLPLLKVPQHVAAPASGQRTPAVARELQGARASGVGGAAGAAGERAGALKRDLGACDSRSVAPSSVGAHLTAMGSNLTRPPPAPS